MPALRLRRYLRHGMLPQLAVFEASVRLGSFTLAADEMHLAQPTVSTQIRKLTEAVGRPLFEQIGKKMYVTAAGQMLYEGCQDILRTLSRIDGSLAELEGLQAGRLRLAVGTAAEHLTMRLLAGFVERHPYVDVALEIRNRVGLMARFAANQDDLYMFANLPTDREVVRQPILPNRLVPIARIDNPLAHERSIAFDRFAQEPFLMREAGSATRSTVAELFARQGREPRIRMELSTNEAIIQAIVAGLGVSIMSRPTYALANDLPQLVTLDVVGFPVDRPWQFVYPVGKQLPPVARAFMDFVRVHAHTLVETPCDREISPRPRVSPQTRVVSTDADQLRRSTAQERPSPSVKACDTDSAPSCSRRTGTARAR